MIVPRIFDWRPRFSLRTALIGVTLICVLLAFWFIAARREADFAAWDLAIRNQICERFAAVPRGVSPLDPVSAMPDFIGDNPSAGFEDSRLAALTATDVHTLWSPSVTFDVRQSLHDESPVALGQRLLAHFESGFAERGLKRISLSPGGICPPVVEKSTIWVSARRDWNTTVTVKVRVDANLGEAEVLVSHFARPLF
jgi:hypothetical protein